MEKQGPVQPARKYKSVILLCFVAIALMGFSMSRHCGMGFALSRSEPQPEVNVADLLDQQRHRVLGAADLEQFKNELDNFEGKETREDKDDGEGQKKKKKKKSILDQTFMRILIGIGVFAVLNIAAITVHHIVHKLGTTTHEYREIEHVYSPF